MIKEFFTSRIKAFGYAFEGWWYVLSTQRNAWIHTVASCTVFILAAWLGLSRLEWAVLILAIAFVWIAEFLNTALEAIVDLASPEQNHLAKVGKDVGAASVLIAAGASILIGLLIMGPPLLERVQGWL